MKQPIANEIVESSRETDDGKIRYVQYDMDTGDVELVMIADNNTGSVEVFDAAGLPIEIEEANNPLETIPDGLSQF